MAIRNIVKHGDSVLNKKCREVVVVDDRIRTLLDDMVDTMREADGVGLAASQVGILKRVVVIEVDDKVYELVNPVIVERSDETAVKNEGCLSCPGVTAAVERPVKVTVEALDRNGEKQRYTGEGLLCMAFCHEIDHLDGLTIVETAQEFIDD
ncbi:MAG: peptide deformylase [Eubacteriales bacterium]|nr:peptide deformylase [Eubacteriales bacterium]